jgi:hypothetical protein
MSRRWASYALLAALGVVMLIRLMRDDPATRQAERIAYSATQQALSAALLFPQVTSSAQVIGLEVLDVTAEKGILVMRTGDGLWYAPEIAGIQPALSADELDQFVVENAAAAMTFLAADQTFDATSDTLERFGLSPQAAYRFRFRALSASGETVEAVVDIGDANPDNVAYYVYVRADVQDNQRVYLIRKEIVNAILSLLSDSLRVVSTPDVAPATSEAMTPVP